MKIGYIGLGRMGKNMVLNLLEKGIEVMAWNRTPQAAAELKSQNSKVLPAGRQVKIAESIDDLINQLDKPRIIWVMVTAAAVDEIINQLAEKLDPDDLVIDGGNSFYKDTLRRNETLTKKGIHFMDAGTSGGIEGARNGACIMVGGAKEDFERAEPIFKAAAIPNAYAHLGPVGAGHFAKTIHNGIEYGMMEAIGEGAAILKNSEFPYDLREVFRIYNTGSIIESRLVGWTLAELKEDPNLDNIVSVIGSGGGAGKTKGEAHWTVEHAKSLGVDVPVIEASVAVRDNSDQDKEDSPNGFRNKIVAAMRWQFGRHPVKKS